MTLPELFLYIQRVKYALMGDSWQQSFCVWLDQWVFPLTHYGWNMQDFCLFPPINRINPLGLTIIQTEELQLELKEWERLKNQMYANFVSLLHSVIIGHWSHAPCSLLLGEYLRDALFRLNIKQKCTFTVSLVFSRSERTKVTSTMFPLPTYVPVIFTMFEYLKTLTF